jgi:rubrerythrin
MHAMTAANLRSAFGGESMAHMRYQIWGDRAEKEGFPNVARLFRAVSYAERVHATNHFGAMRDVAGAFDATSGGGFGLATTSENLQGAIDGETFEVNEMYPAYMAVAKMQEEKGAERSMHYAISAEKIHAAMYQEAKQAVDAGKDVDLGPVRVCAVCGYTAEGEAPDKCPICGVARDRFKTFA